jgi:glutamine synthetase
MMNIASSEELAKFLRANPNVSMFEILVPDINGILRCKRIPRIEVEAFFRSGVKNPASIALLNCAGELGIDLVGYYGDPDKLMMPIANTLKPIKWLKSETAQVLSTFTELDGTPGMFDSRNILIKALEPLYKMGLKAVVATELEFYLVEDSDGTQPKPKLSKIPGTSLDQPGIQYAMPEDLWEHDAFLEEVRQTCIEQDVPMTTVHSEYSPAQFEINLHHCDDPVLACDHAVLLKRIVKGVALKYGMSATFMAKPFSGLAGNGLHIHFSLYDDEGNNIFADSTSTDMPAISQKLLHAIGGLAETMPEAMAIFAPTANAYRRLVPDNFVPLTPNWGYNHRDVALRIPVSGDQDRRVEHRVASADANPYLVMAAVAAGIHHGMTTKSKPNTAMITEGEELEEVITLPRQWSVALDRFAESKVFPEYFGKEYCQCFETIRRSECDEFTALVSNVDYEWYLRTV